MPFRPRRFRSAETLPVTRGHVSDQPVTQQGLNRGLGGASRSTRKIPRGNAVSLAALLIRLAINWGLEIRTCQVDARIFCLTGRVLEALRCHQGV